MKSENVLSDSQKSGSGTQALHSHGPVPLKKHF
jgi:hypothetical protein